MPMASIEISATDNKQAPPETEAAPTIPIQGKATNSIPISIFESTVSVKFWLYSCHYREPGSSFLVCRTFSYR
ncbi:MAG: hypothetical protein ACI9WS_001539 [Paraglaciecola psychrophila]|jgi:hypothetical protein